MKKKKALVVVTLLMILGLIGLVFKFQQVRASQKAAQTEIIVADQLVEKAVTLEKAVETEPVVKTEAVEVLDKDLWQKPTGGAYPEITWETQLRIVANITDQRIYFYDDQELIYTMVTSSGLDDEVNATPLGHFEIQNIRGESFFNGALGEGALNYVSFKDYGVYLFHSVPVKADMSINIEEAEKLGTRASHGCFRLSIPDSEWFYDNIIEGTPLEITE